MVGALRRRLGLLVRRLVVRVVLLWLRVWRREQWWSGGVDRHRRLGRLLRRRLGREAVASRRHNHRRARRQVRWCRRVVAQRRRRRVRLHLLRRWQVHLATSWLRSLARLRVRRLCSLEAAVATQ